MNSSVKNTNPTQIAVKVWFEEGFLCLLLSDTREVKAPMKHYPRLFNASDEDRNNFKLIGLGTGIHWPTINEDLSVESIVLGRV